MFVTCVIIIVVGLVMFAIPIIPGAPIYLVCGVTIASQANQLGDSFVLSMLLGTATGLFLRAKRALQKSPVSPKETC